MISGDAKGTIHYGVLKKSPPEDQMRKRRRWRDRYFTLYRKANGSILLRYYRTNSKSKADEEEMKGFIDMATCLTLESGHTLKGFEKMFSFSIVTPRRTYFLLSKKEAEMREWVHKICESCGFAATSSTSPATIRDQLHQDGNGSGSHGDIRSANADGEYNDAFSDNTGPPRPMMANANYYKSADSMSKVSSSAMRSNFSIDLAHQVQTNCSVTPYESLDASPGQEYGREMYNSSAAAEYFDHDPKSRLNNQVYGSLDTNAPQPRRKTPKNPNNNHQDDIYGATYASTGIGSYTTEYQTQEEYGYGMLPSPNESLQLKSAALQNQNISANNGAHGHYQPQLNIPGQNSKHEHYLNLVPEKPQLEKTGSPRDEIDGMQRGGAPPPPVNRSLKPHVATFNSPSHSAANNANASTSSNGHRSLSEIKKKGPANLTLPSGSNTHAPRTRHLNDVLSSVPLSPVTSFSKKRDEIPTFFSTPQPNHIESPPSPSRLSHDSYNSSNSASDAESVAHHSESVSSTPGSGHSQSRISSSLPISAGPTLNNNNTRSFEWSRKEINYTELAPDSPAYHNLPQGYTGAKPIQYTNINSFNFSSAADIARDMGSPIQPRLQASKSLDHTKPGSLTSTPDSKRRADVEYTQVDSDRTKIVNDLRAEREQLRKEKQSPKL